MENAPTRKRFSLRGFTSLLLTGLFLILGFSGAMLYGSPRGRVANWTDWTLFGLGKEQWEGIHLNGSVLFLVVAILHLVLNWRPFWGYIKKRAGLGLNRKVELALATAITAGVVVGTLYQVPPFSTMSDWRHEIKDYWERRTARAPVPHAEEFTLAEFAGHIQLSPDEAIEALRKEGYEVAAPTITLAELAGTKAVPPSRILADIQKHFPQAGSFQGNGGGGQGGHGMGRGMGMGLGSGMGSGCNAEAAECSEGDSVAGDAPSQDADPGSCPSDAAPHSGAAGQSMGPGGGQGMGQGSGGGRGLGRGLGQGRAGSGTRPRALSRRRRHGTRPRARIGLGGPAVGGFHPLRLAGIDSRLTGELPAGAPRIGGLDTLRV